MPLLARDSSKPTTAYHILLSPFEHHPPNRPPLVRINTVTMAEFVRAQIFGTTFEITSRFVATSPGAHGTRIPGCERRQQ